jgi:hypothetical protein
MQPRDLWIAGSALVLAGVAGFAWLGQTAAAEELPPPAGEPPAAQAVPEAGSSPAADALAAPLPAAPAAPVTVAATQRRATDTAGWTKGVVRGDIQLAVSVLDRLQDILVFVEEARTPFGTDGAHRPFSIRVPVKRERGTPTFEIPDVPFSEYPYVVSVYSRGVNGSRSTVTVDQRTPIVDVVLRITPGTPLTLLVRDQDQQPWHGVEVAAIAVGEPAGRPNLKAVSDNFGSIVFEDVLAGEYQLFPALGGQALTEPQTITVPAGGAMQVRPHSHTLMIERGVPVTLRVHDAGGYPIVGAKVVATATDRVKLTTYETATDLQGNATWARLQPGTWQFTVTMDRWHMWDAQRTLKLHQDPLLVDVRLVPMR